MPAKLMKDPLTRPPLYFKHQDILSQTQLDSTMVALYLHENMLNFYADIDDIANCPESYSFTDNVTSSLTYSFNNQQYSYEMDQLSALVATMAITEHNIHGGDLKGSHKNFYAMQKPFYYEHMSLLK